MIFMFPYINIARGGISPLSVVVPVKCRILENEKSSFHFTSKLSPPLPQSDVTDGKGLSKCRVFEAQNGLRLR